MPVNALPSTYGADAQVSVCPLSPSGVFSLNDMVAAAVPPALSGVAVTRIAVTFDQSVMAAASCQVRFAGSRLIVESVEYRRVTCPAVRSVSTTGSPVRVAVIVLEPRSYSCQVPSGPLPSEARALSALFGNWMTMLAGPDACGP